MSELIFSIIPGEKAPLPEFIDVEGCRNRCHTREGSVHNVTVGIRLNYQAQKLRPLVMSYYLDKSYDETKYAKAPSDICDGACPRSNELRLYKFEATVYSWETSKAVSAEVVAKLLDENNNVAMCGRFFVYII